MTVVRPARSSDAGAIVALWRAVDDMLPSVTDDERSVTTLLGRDPVSMLVAEEAGHLVGTLIVGWDGWRGNLYRLAVDPSARRRGVARTLVAQAEMQLAAQGCRRVSAIVAASEPPAVGFCGRGGLRPTGRDAPLRQDPRSFVTSRHHTGSRAAARGWAEMPLVAEALVA